MAYNSEKISLFPTAPGIYIMKGQGNTVIYVGKAKNIRQRVKQYFVPGRDSREMIPYLVSNIVEIETLVVTSEKEALILERNLIQQYQPRYNAMLKDNKSYLSLKVTTNHPWPMVHIVRQRDMKKEKGALYFGPYTSAEAARRTLDLLKRLFPLRQCSDQEFARRTRPCILYQMHRCVAPCVGYCSKENYEEYVKRTVQFLKGNDKEIIQELRKEMDIAADALEFERAASIYHTIKQIQVTVEGQKVDILDGGDYDVLSIYRQGEEVIITKLVIRAGKLVDAAHFSFKDVIELDDELLESFLLQHYEGEGGPNRFGYPTEILLPIPLESEISLEEHLKTKLFYPQKGEKKALIAMSLQNGEAYYKRERDVAVIREKNLEALQETLRLKNFPERIECVDNSNMSGDEPVAALVAFNNGVRDKNFTRYYKLDPQVASDDYQSMREVLSRRFRRMKEEGNAPDLLIIDGGKGHLNIALQILKEFDVLTVDVIGLAKEDSRHDKGITQEQIFLPEVKDPLLLPKHSKVLFFLQQIRDEAHRLAITYQKLRQRKKIIRSKLDEVPGIGIIKKKRLLKTFGSVKRIQEATDAELKAVPGINSENILQLRLFLKSDL